GVAASFTDANPLATADEFSATITWGDGSANSTGTVQANSNGGFDVTGSHTYAEEGCYTIGIQIVDARGSSATTQTAANVADAALTLLSLTAPSAMEGIATGTVTVATFADANDNPDIADYNATIRWGDGSTSTATAANGGIVANDDGTFSVLGSHTYAEEA